MQYIEELNRTPEILTRALEEAPEAALIQAPLLIFCGCGTSHYLGAQLARLCAANNRPAIAAEAVELLEALPSVPPESVFVFLSRSGSSMETVLAMQAVQAAGRRTFYLGCTPNSPLADGCACSRLLPYARETLPLESFSFPAQFTALALCCGMTVPRDTPAIVRKAFAQARRLYARAVEGMQLHRMICLGAPFYMPLLKELMLKNGELTQKATEAWGILEFRHGPRTWADAHCLITAVPGVRTRQWDVAMGRELVGYGCKLLWCGEDAPDGAIRVTLTAPACSAQAIVELTAFQTALAAQIGLADGVDAAALRNITYCVEVM